MRFEELQTKRVAIVGLGIEGIATAEYFLKHNIPFTVIDEKQEEELLKSGEEWAEIIKKLHAHHVRLILGKPFALEMFQPFDVIVRSPGVALHKEYLQQYRGNITSQTKLFFDNCPAKIIGVTGTKGKGTTASLIYEMLKKAGKDAYVGGNIGMAPIAFLDTLSPQSFVSLELSSFQLEDIERSPHVAVMLMVTSEHLSDFRNQNFHKSVDEYHAAKRNILKFQTEDDMAVLNIDYPATERSKEFVKGKVGFVSRYQRLDTGCFVENNDIILRWNGTQERVLSLFDILLPGKHNLENVCAAVIASYSLGVSLEDIRFVLRTFKGLSHRLELIREVDGARYYDDSFSTVPETAIAAIEAFSNPEILILGGSSKNSDFTKLGEVIAEANNIKAIIGIGIEWPQIKSRIKNLESRIKVIEGLKDMESIVRACRELSAPGDVVLLSPACASFDMFKNYKDRGDQFKEQVSKLEFKPQIEL